MPGTGLRRATHLSSQNKTGYRGVCWYPRYGKWNAQVSPNGKLYNLGYFDDIHDAGIAASDFRLQHEAELQESEMRRRRAQSAAMKAYLADPEAKVRHMQGLRTMTTEQRSVAAKRGAKTMTPEQRSDRARKARRAQLEASRAKAA